MIDWEENGGPKGQEVDNTEKGEKRKKIGITEG